jgi:hypothetical protein
MSDGSSSVATTENRSLVIADEFERALAAIKGSRASETAQTATASLLNLIPYAGGTVATALSSYWTSRQIDKICDLMKHLHDSLKAAEVKVEDVLTAEQVNEVLQEGVASIATASDQMKIDYLKTGIARTFTERTMSFDRKHFFLSLLRNMSGLELKVLRAVYEEPDPFVRYEELQLPNPATNVLTYATINPATWEAHWEEGETSYLQELSRRFGEEVVIVTGVAESLDQRRLTLLAPSLGGKWRKVLKPPKNPQHLVMTIPSGTVFQEQGLYAQSARMTPREASATEFGRAFFAFVRDL